MLVDRFSPIYGKQVPGFTDRALWTLEAYEWPGNVRELENVVERAVPLVDDGQRIGTEHLPSELLKAQDASIGVSRGGSLVRKPTASYRSEEHTSELQSLMRISYAVFCLQKKTTQLNTTLQPIISR